jgi:hypothetical protein
MRVFQVPRSEQETLRKMGTEKPQDLYAICQACSRILENKGTAVQLIRGTIISQFRAAGVSIAVAERLAEEFCKKLIAATPEAPNS